MKYLPVVLIFALLAFSTDTARAFSVAEDPRETPRPLFRMLFNTHS